MRKIYYFILVFVLLALCCACRQNKSQPQIRKITFEGRLNYIADDSTVVLKDEFHNFVSIVRTPHCIYYRIAGRGFIGDFWGTADTDMKHRLFPAHRKIVAVWDLATQKHYYLGRWLYSDNWRVYKMDGSLLIPQTIRVTTVRAMIKAAKSKTARNVDITEIVLNDLQKFLH